MKMLVAFLLLIGVCRAGDRDLFRGMDEYIHAGMKTWKVPGLAIAVVKNGEVVLARAYGTREVGFDRPVTQDTVFSIASCTKSFTACGIGMLVDEGRLAWDDPVRKHWPGFQVADPYVTEQATIRDLLCHRVGLVRGDLLGMSGGFSKPEMLKQIALLPQAVPFRSKVTYSNLMYTVLGEVIEQKTGETWERAMTGRIFRPLGMTSTTTDANAIPDEHRAVRHRLYDGELTMVKTPMSDRMLPAGAIHSSISDMAHWLNFLLQEGRHDGRNFVAVSTIREMHTMQQAIPVKWRPGVDEYDSRFAGTGLGWFVRDYRGRKIVQHGGAWGAEVAVVPEEQLGIVVLSNRDWNGLVWMLIFDVIDAYVVGPEQAWQQGEKWQRWLKIGGPDLTNQELKRHRGELEAKRKRETRPSQPLAKFSGTYRSQLYSPLSVTVREDHLRVHFGDYAADLEHWEEDSFYGRGVIEPFFDWLVKFEIDGEGDVIGLEIINVGW
jgi:CubicO group peptidase (beta-lactamase class C family)